jgi:hypothetical protein
LLASLRRLEKALHEAQGKMLEFRQCAREQQQQHLEALASLEVPDVILWRDDPFLFTRTVALLDKE